MMIPKIDKAIKETRKVSWVLIIKEIRADLSMVVIIKVSISVMTNLDIAKIALTYLQRGAVRMRTRLRNKSNSISKCQSKSNLNVDHPGTLINRVKKSTKKE